MLYDPVLAAIATIVALVAAELWLRGSPRGLLLIRVRSRPTVPGAQSRGQRTSSRR